MDVLAQSRPVLVIEASTPAARVALLLPAGDAVQRGVTMGAGTADELPPAVMALLESAGVAASGLGAIVCGEGPGSFTSLRIAGALAKGLALGIGCPLYALPSLALAAAGLPDEAPAGTYLVHADALRGERYVLEVHRAPSGAVSWTSGPARRSLDDLRAARVPLVAVGPSPVGLASAFEVVPDARGAARALGAWRSTPVELATWEPRYGRLAEAQVKWEATHGRALPGSGSP